MSTSCNKTDVSGSVTVQNIFIYLPAGKPTADYFVLLRLQND